MRRTLPLALVLGVLATHSAHPQTTRERIDAALEEQVRRLGPQRSVPDEHAELAGVWEICFSASLSRPIGLVDGQAPLCGRLYVRVDSLPCARVLNVRAELPMQALIGWTDERARTPEVWFSRFDDGSVRLGIGGLRSADPCIIVGAIHRHRVFIVAHGSADRLQGEWDEEYGEQERHGHVQLRRTRAEAP
jgi:hypothetical protein